MFNTDDYILKSGIQGYGKFKAGHTIFGIWEILGKVSLMN
jgi:hypothetical protein